MVVYPPWTGFVPFPKVLVLREPWHPMQSTDDSTTPLMCRALLLNVPSVLTWGWQPLHWVRRLGVRPLCDPGVVLGGAPWHTVQSPGAAGVPVRYVSRFQVGLVLEPLLEPLIILAPWQ